MGEEESSIIVLTEEIIKPNLKTLGFHPFAQRHTFLELAINSLQLQDISILQNYPLIMYLDVSGNQITSLDILKSITALVQLKAKNNKLTKCLDFSPPLCSPEHSWETGHEAAGSNLTLADLSENLIETLDNLSHHPFLECLLLGKNKINQINGLQSLKYLQTLDLSDNNITKIEGLDNLPIRELRLSGNQLTSLQGIEKLPHLTALDVSRNRIITLAPLQSCVNLNYLDASYNHIQYIRQIEFLLEISWLQVLLLQYNPCYKKECYRLRVIFRLPKLKRLDTLPLSSEERIRAFNLYHSPEGDIQDRQRVHEQYCPNIPFVDYSPYQLPYDEELELSMNDLQQGGKLPEIQHFVAKDFCENINEVVSHSPRFQSENQ